MKAFQEQHDLIIVGEGDKEELENSMHLSSNKINVEKRYRFFLNPTISDSYVDPQGYDYFDKTSAIKVCVIKHKRNLIVVLLILLVNMFYLFSNVSLDCDFQFHFND